MNSDDGHTPGRSDPARRSISSGRPRRLVNEILSLQLVSMALIGVLAVAGFYWGAQWALQANHERWAQRWTAELEELGAPLYLDNEREITLLIERFVEKYAEIRYVRYYREDGSFLYAFANAGSAAAEPNSLGESLIARLTERAGTDEPYLLEEQTSNRLFRIAAPVWIETIADDGLFSFDPADIDLAAETEVLGFVTLELDFTWYREQLLGSVQIAVVGIVAFLIVFGLIIRALLRRSLASLSNLQRPIAALARGELSARFEPPVHAEIAEIVDALKTTAAALKERDARLSRLAHSDSLTGLANRHRFIQELEREIDQCTGTERRGALFFVDLDQFKYINDTCGYLAGDQLLRQIAATLEHCVQPPATIARFGGDEFAVLAPDTTRKQARALGTAIVEEMRKIVHVEGDVAFHAQCSVGITMINSDRFTPDELIAQADVACREAKSRGRNRMDFYRASGGEPKRVAADIGWVGLIRDALASDAFILRYQPIAHIRTGETSHHEVLLRLKQGDDKLVSPDAFQPAALRFGLMAEIDVWVLEHAIAALAEFRRTDPGLRFTINLSGAVFETRSLASLVRETLIRHDVPPECLILEITEQVALRSLDTVGSEIATLREMGCEIAIDDFGTGYSAFSYIKQLPADYLKIDGAFVRDVAKGPVDETMVRVIGEVGRAAGMRTIAEYVTSATAYATLARLGIDYAQGYYIGKPTAAPIRKSVDVPFTVPQRRRTRNAHG